MIAQQQGPPVSITKWLERQRAQKKKEAESTTDATSMIVDLKQPVLNDADNHADLDLEVNTASFPPVKIKTKHITSTASIPPVKTKIKNLNSTALSNIGSTRGWDEQYLSLVNFYIMNEHSSVLRSDPNKVLSGWVKRQRNNRKDGKLTQDQIDLLDDLHFVWHRTNNSWNIRYNMLVDYYRQHGDGSTISSKSNRQLSEWIQRQKREYRTKKSMMCSTRIDALERVPGWTW